MSSSRGYLESRTLVPTPDVGFLLVAFLHCCVMSAPHVDTGLLGVAPVLTRKSASGANASAVKCLLHIPLEVGQVSLEAVKSVILS